LRSVHGSYAPPGEAFGTRIETFFIAVRGHWRHRGQAVFCRQDCFLHARAPNYGHTEA
jgi:hypothetical protein